MSTDGEGDGDATGRSHVLRTCFIDDHDARSGRATACLIGFGGTVVFVAGVLGAINAAAPRVSLVWIDTPAVLSGSAGIVTSTGAIALGLALLGRQRLARRVVGAGADVKERLGNSDSGSGEDG